jgi:cytochrome P450
MTLFLAGHETTANLLSWTFYLLSQNPQAEALLSAELREILGNRTPTMDDIPKLHYTEMVLSESMRLFPPAWAIGRRALVDQMLGPFFIPKDSIVLLSAYMTQRDPRYFPEPSRFDPGRWSTESRASRPQYSYFPFGGGPRRCIGESFAWTEVILVLATLANNWRMKLDQAWNVEPQALFTLRPRNGIRMTLERR